jgi:hypothetical protein
MSNIHIDGYPKVRESLYARIIIWASTIQNHINTKTNVPRYEDFCMKYRIKWHQNPKYLQIPIIYAYKKCETSL